MFILQNAPAQPLELPGIEVTVPDVPGRTAKFDLTLFAWSVAEGLSLQAEYSSALFDRTTIRRLLRNFAALLEAAVADPGRSIRDLRLLTEAEAHHVLVEWNDTAKRENAAQRDDEGRSVPDVFAAQSWKMGFALCLV